jgi:N12 class adenine-specific DNA methylase
MTRLLARRLDRGLRLESNTAKPGPIFTERVIAPPPSPAITRQ